MPNTAERREQESMHPPHAGDFSHVSSTGSGRNYLHDVKAPSNSRKLDDFSSRLENRSNTGYPIASPDQFHAPRYSDSYSDSRAQASSPDDTLAAARARTAQSRNLENSSSRNNQLPSSDHIRSSGNGGSDYADNLAAARAASAPSAKSENMKNEDSQRTPHGNFRVPQRERMGKNKVENESGASSADRLAAARKENIGSKIHEAAKTVKDLAEVATPMGALSLLKQIDLLNDMPYVAAGVAALAKDLIDIATFETVVLPILFSFLCSIFIYMMLMLVGANGKKKQANAIFKKIGYLVGGGIFSAIPGLDIFPFETATVVVLYFMELSERRNAQE